MSVLKQSRPAYPAPLLLSMLLLAACARQPNIGDDMGLADFKRLVEEAMSGFEGYDSWSLLVEAGTRDFEAERTVVILGFTPGTPQVTLSEAERLLLDRIATRDLDSWQEGLIISARYRWNDFIMLPSDQVVSALLPCTELEGELEVKAAVDQLRFNLVFFDSPQEQTGIKVYACSLRDPSPEERADIVAAFESAAVVSMSSPR